MDLWTYGPMNLSTFNLTPPYRSSESTVDDD